MTTTLYPLLAVLLLGQCTDTIPKPDPQQADFGETFAVPKGGAVTLTDEETGSRLNIQLQQIYDSRCPANVTCVTMGNATVILSAANKQERIDDVNLCIGTCHPDPVRSKHTLTLQVGSEKYTFTLKNVQPYPGLENNNAVQTAEMIVTRSF